MPCGLPGGSPGHEPPDRRNAGGWTERGRWPLDAEAVIYANDLLVAVEKAGVAYLFPGKPPRREPFPISRDRCETE